jgi:hypothetical protein
VSNVSATVKDAISTILTSVLQHVRMENTLEMALCAKRVLRLVELAFLKPIAPDAKSATFCAITHASAPAKRAATSARLRTLSSANNALLVTLCLTQKYATLI